MRLPWGDEIAIDLGTANTHIGLEARRMLEHDVEGVHIVCPVRNGVIADFDAAVTMLRHFLQQALGRRPLLSPMVITSHPDEATQVERRALIDAIRAAGGGHVLSLQRALAAAIGGGIQVSSDSSQMVIDLGAGITNAGVVAMGLTTAGLTVRWGGDYLSEVVRRAIRQTQNIRVNPATAEQIKVRVGTLLTNGNDTSIHIEGVNDSGESAISADLDLSEVPSLLSHGLNRIVAEVIWLLDELPPRQQSEIAARGALLTGGGAMLEGVDSYFAEKLGIPVSLATDPPSCTILGLESVLNDPQGVSLQGRRFRTSNG